MFLGNHCCDEKTYDQTVWKAGRGPLQPTRERLFVIEKTLVQLVRHSDGPKDATEHQGGQSANVEL